MFSRPLSRIVLAYSVAVVPSLAACGSSAPAPQVRPDSWTVTGRLVSPHLAGQTLTPLANGRVLLAGGVGGGGTATRDAEVYDPLTGSWAETAPLPSPVTGHTAVLLGDGSVLVAGGRNTGDATAAAEIFRPDERDPSSGRMGRWQTIEPMAAARTFHTATVMQDGRVLVAGGCAEACSGTRQPADASGAEIYDPRSAAHSTSRWRRTGALGHGRSGHRAVLLDDGRVMVIGGQTAAATLVEDEIYDPGATDPATGLRGAWADDPNGITTLNLNEHAVARLRDGGVLVSGGRSGETGTAERLAQVRHGRAGPWTSRLMAQARYAHTATTLPDGRVVIAGGVRRPPGHEPLATVDIFDPVIGRWTTAAPMAEPRSGHSAALLEQQPCGSVCGRVLVAGGVACQACEQGRPTGVSAELYNPPPRGGTASSAAAGVVPLPLPVLLRRRAGGRRLIAGTPIRLGRP